MHCVTLSNTPSSASDIFTITCGEQPSLSTIISTTAIASTEENPWTDQWATTSSRVHASAQLARSTPQPRNSTTVSSQSNVEPVTPRLASILTSSSPITSIFTLIEATTQTYTSQELRSGLPLGGALTTVAAEPNIPRNAMQGAGTGTKTVD